MKCKAELRVEFGCSEDARIAFESLLQETEFKKKSETELERKGSELILRINAEDLATLRASVNSYLRLLSVLKNVKNVCER